MMNELRWILSVSLPVRLLIPLASKLPIIDPFVYWWLTGSPFRLLNNELTAEDLEWAQKYIEDLKESRDALTF